MSRWSPGTWGRMLFGSTTAATSGLTGADALVRTPLPLSRRVGFVALAGGSGVTASAASVATLLAGRRQGLVLAVDASGGQSGLRRQTGQTGRPRNDSGAERRRRTARTAAEATDGLGRTEAGLHLLDLAGPQRRAASTGEWASEVAPVARFFDLVLTDWGVRAATADLAEVAATSHVLVVVTRAGRPAVTQAASVADELRRGAAAPRVVVTVVDVARASDRIHARAVAALGLPAAALPYEPQRARQAGPSRRRFGSRTRRAVIDLAGAVMREVLASQTSPETVRVPTSLDRLGPAGVGAPRVAPGRSGRSADELVEVPAP